MSVNGCLCPLALLMRICGSIGGGNHLPRAAFENVVALTQFTPFFVRGAPDDEQSPHGFLCVSGTFEGLHVWAQTSATASEEEEARARQSGGEMAAAL